MKKHFLFVVLLWLALSSYSQTSNLDELPLHELKRRLALSSNDTTTVQLQLALGHLMFYKATRGEKDVDSAMNFATQASILSRRLNYQFGIINAMLLNAETYYNRNERQRGLETVQEALAYSQAHHNLDGEARSYYLIAQYYQETDPGALPNKIFYINKAIPIFRKEQNMLWLSFMLTQNAKLLFEAERPTEGLKLLFDALDLGKAVSRRTVEGIYWNIGVTSFKFGDYTNAQKYNLLALKTAKEVNDTSIQLCLINHLIASTYIKIEDYDKAIPYSQDVLKLAERYHATEYIKTESSALALEYTHTKQLSKALAILNDMDNKARGNVEKLSVKVDFLNNLVYAKHILQASQYAQEVKGLLAHVIPVDSTEMMNAYNSLASYYLETGQERQAYRYTELYSAMARKLNNIAGIGKAENLYYKLVTSKRDPKSAVAHFLEEQESKDSAENIVKDYQIFLLDMENKTLEKNRHIDSLTTTAQIIDVKMKRTQLIQKVTIAGAAMLLITTGLVYSRYRLKQRSNALLMQQKAEIDQKNDALQKLVMEKNELLKDKDEFLLEKDLLLKEVNHRVKNNLQIVMSLLEAQSGYMFNESAQQAILESQNRVQSITLIHDQLFRTDKIAEIDLRSYISELVQSLDYSINRQDQKVEIKCIVEHLFLDVSQAVPVGIILNELVTNSLKYAFPNNSSGRIIVMVKQVECGIEMRVSDNGVGLATDLDLSRPESLGMTLIKGLTSQLKGTLEIDNTCGVTITIKFPLEAAVTSVVNA